MYTFHNQQGELNGLVYLHAKDLNSAGTEEFHSRVTDILQMRFAVGNKDEPSEKPTGPEIFHTKEGIIMEKIIKETSWKR